MREILLMNDGWKFKEGDLPLENISGHFETYMHAKAQKGRGEASPMFYDGNWHDVILPHDYVLDGNPSNTYNESQGSYKRTNGWYRRTFKLEESDKNKRLVLQFNGAGMKSEVYVNGHLAGQNQSMYNSFSIDITSFVTFADALNAIAVHTVCDDIEGWWYEGGGIYRDVYLVKTESISVDNYGTWIAPSLKIEQDESKNVWEVPVETTVYNMNENASITVMQEIIDNAKNSIAKTKSNYAINYGKNSIKQCLEVINPHLWSLEDTNLYTLKTTILKNTQTINNDIKVKAILDEYSTLFGFRTVTFDGAHGMFINGKHVKLRGVCIHQDHGNLGVAVPSSVLEFRIKKLKEMGINAYRCAHNNPAPELFDICDRLGMVVLDENRWFCDSEETKRQIKSMVLRDRNHPSLIAYSVANEEPLQNTLVGQRLVESLKLYVRSLDKTRPVTIALNAGYFADYAAVASDVLGVNYMLSKYPEIKALGCKKAVMATESGASENNRGVYFSQINELKEYKNGYATAYDKRRAPFGSSYLEAIKASEENEFISGTFMWAGIEYRGEANYPKLFSGCGMLDSAGIAKDNYYLVKALWTKEPIVHILPHWDLQGHEGEHIECYTYTNCDEVELIVNDNSIGRQKVESFKMPKWDVVYEPGKIEAIGYRYDKKNAKAIQVTKETLHTSGVPENILVTACNKTTNSGLDTAIYEISVTDKDGNHCYTASDRISCEVISGGRILALSNGDSLDHENARNHNRKLFNGALQLIIAIEEGAKEMSFVVTDTENNLKKKVICKPQNMQSPKKVAICESVLEIRSFRNWPSVKTMDAIDYAYNFNDMNTSEPIELKFFNNTKYIQEEQNFTVITGKTIAPVYPKNMKLYLKIEKAYGDFKIKVFHDSNCWPNPTPKELKTFYLDVKKLTGNNDDVNESNDTIIELKGVSGNEKLNIIIVATNKTKFHIEHINFFIN